MCHLVLFLPVLALPVFWLLALPVAIAVYAVILLLSIGMYVQIMIGMRRPLFGGPDALIGREGRLIPLPHEHLGLTLDGEMWTVRSTQPLTVGQRVRVVEREGLRLVVAPVPAPDQARTEEPARQARADAPSAPGGVLHRFVRARHHGARPGH